MILEQKLAWRYRLGCVKSQSKQEHQAMDGSIELSADQRKVLLAVYRWGKDVRAARRAHIVLLVAEG